MKIILALLVVFFLLFLLGLCCFLLSFWGWSGEATNGSPFECGFSPLSSANLSFSMPFFFVSLIFLLFDVEILLLCFYPFTLVLDPSGSVVIFFVVFLVLFSTLYEWVKGVLIWV